MSEILSTLKNILQLLMIRCSFFVSPKLFISSIIILSCSLATFGTQNLSDTIVNLHACSYICIFVIQLSWIYSNGIFSLNSCLLRPTTNWSQLMFMTINLPRSVCPRMCVISVIIFCAPCIAYKCGIFIPPISMGPCTRTRAEVLLHPIAGKNRSSATDCNILYSKMKEAKSRRWQKMHHT